MCVSGYVYGINEYVKWFFMYVNKYIYIYIMNVYLKFLIIKNQIKSFNGV